MNIRKPIDRKARQKDGGRARPEGGKRPRGRHGPPRGDAGGGPYWLFGLHSGLAALHNPARRVGRVLCTAPHRERIEAALAERGGAAVEVVEREEIDRRLPPGAVHQGLALHVEPLPDLVLEDALAAEAVRRRVVVLDQVTDPQNVGAILRSAAAFGALALVVQRRHSPPETSALAKAASGGLERVPIIRETNLARAIGDLQERGFWCIGLDPDGGQTLAEAAPQGPAALVLGAEGPGLRRLTAERCDALARLPIGGVESLNVSAAAAIGLYELNRDAP